MKQITTKSGEVLQMDETETLVFNNGAWTEIMEDQEGEHYFFSSKPTAIYLSSSPTPPTKEVSTVGFRGGEWEISKFKEGDYSICEEDAGDMIAEGLTEANAQRIVTAVNNHDALVSALQDAMEDLKNLACNYAGYSTNEDKPAYIGKLASYAKAKELLTSIK